MKPTDYTSITSPAKVDGQHIDGLGRMTSDDDGIVRLQFVSEEAAQAFMRDFSPPVELDAMPDIPAKVGDDRDAIAELIGRLEAKYGMEFTVTKRTGEKTHHVGFDGHPLVGKAVAHLRAALTSSTKPWKCSHCGSASLTECSGRGCFAHEEEQAVEKGDGDLREVAEKMLADPQCWGWHNALRAALTSPAKVGGDERECFENLYRSLYPSIVALCPDKFNRDEDGEYADGAVSVSWSIYRAALSADGGDRKDAERYRIVRHKVCIVGDAFHIINLRPTYVAPDAGAELDAVVDAIAAKAKGDA